MKFILFVMILTGDHHGIQTTGFIRMDQCEKAAEIINTRSALTNYRSERRPYAFCIKNTGWSRS